MPKNIHTPRDELICGKLDKAIERARDHRDVMLVELLQDIAHDADRMEKKLIERKEQAALAQKPRDEQCVWCGNRGVRGKYCSPECTTPQLTISESEALSSIRNRLLNRAAEVSAVSLQGDYNHGKVMGIQEALAMLDEAILAKFPQIKEGV